MRISALKYAILTWVSGLTMIIFFLMPFHAFLTVWISSGIGHYTALRLWKEALLVVCLIGATYLFFADQKIRYHTISRRLVQLILAYIILTLIWGVLAYYQNDVTAKALGYGLISNLRYLVFFLVTWMTALRMSKLRLNWQWLVVYPSVIVVIFGLLQAFVLPHNFLTHFGYSAATIPAGETINHNQNYIRIMSTLRGANPLGAYMVIPISCLTVLLVRRGRSWFHAALLLGSVIVLFYSFSRSAWIGAILSVLTILFLSHLSPKIQKISYILGGGVIVIGLILVLILHNNTRYQNLIFHTQKHSAVASTSDQGHSQALKNGLKDLVHHPGGDGPGTAGPASVYNTGHPARIAENYYVQIGQEVGWFGLVLFILINVGAGWLLYIRRDDSLALSLLASLIGISFINLFSHAWSDDTLAYIWWGLTGVALTSWPKEISYKQGVKDDEAEE